jgi:hypothetical protein
LDFFGTIFVPRLLILAYIFENQGYSTWFYIHLLFALFVWMFLFIFSKHAKS